MLALLCCSRTICLVSIRDLPPGKRTIIYLILSPTLQFCISSVIKYSGACHAKRSHCFLKHARHELCRPVQKWRAMLCSFAVGDGGSAFKQHSSVALALRRYDIDPAHNARRCAWQELIVTAGPTEPPSYDSILGPTVDFFKKYDIGTFSKLAPTMLNSWKRVVSRCVTALELLCLPDDPSLSAGRASTPFQLQLSASSTVPHWPVLGLLQGDTPFMEKLFKLASHGSYGACYRCSLEGEHIAGAVRCVFPIPPTTVCE